MHPLRKNIHVIFVFLILSLCYGYFLPKSGDSDWVANSRANLVFAIVNRGVLHIDDYHVNTGDKAFFNGHYYTPTSIGPSLVAIPIYAIFNVIRSAPIDNPYQNQWDLAWITFFAISIPSAIIAVIVLKFTSHFVGEERNAMIIALIYGLATIAFPYSKAFFQHQMASFGLFVGFYLLWLTTTNRLAQGWLWFIGLLFGMAIISEYPVIVPVGILLLWATYERPDLSALTRILLGAVPPVLLLAAYNLATFDTVLPVGYRYHVIHQAVHGQGLMGITTPSAYALYAITLSPYRGLFFISPILLLALPGLYYMLSTAGKVRRLACLIIIVLIYFFLYNSAYQFWSGGYSIGPRYLVPLIPFLMLPLAWTFKRWWQGFVGRMVIGLLSLASVLQVWGQTIAGQYYPSAHLANPLVDYSWPLLIQGDIAANYGTIMGLSGWWSLIPLLAILVLITVGYLVSTTLTLAASPRHRSAGDRKA